MQKMLSNLFQCSTACQSGQDAIIGDMKIAPFAAFFLLLTACLPIPALTPTVSPTPLPPVTLRPYASPAPASTPTSAPQEATPLPSPTPTPFIYSVDSGDTLLEIAARYGLTLEDILNANPGVDPNFLTVGMTLTIPLTPGDGDGAPPQALALPLELGSPQCFPLPDGARWCAVEVTNPGEQPVSAVVLAWVSAPGAEAVTAALPFDVLPPHTTLPLAVTLPPAAEGSLPQVTLRSALPWPGAETSWPRPAVPESILPALPAGQVRLTGSLPPAEEVETPAEGAVLAAGYDARGRITALRQALVPLDAAAPAPWKLVLASLGDPIVEVRVWVANRPTAVSEP